MNLQKPTMTLRFALLVLIAVSLTISSSSAAMMLSLGGPSPDSAYVNADATSALYAASRGKTVAIAQVGGLAPNGDEFSDFGLPQVGRDGSIVFGAETRGQDGRGRWDIFRVDPTHRRLSEALEPGSGDASCLPVFATDPAPVLGEDGSLVFIASETSGPDALVRHNAGGLHCLARVGERTNTGRVITMLKFGSADVAANGDIVFLARVSTPHAGDKAAVLEISPGKGITEVALEGQKPPDGKPFTNLFGRPAISATRYGSLVAFANRAAAGTTIFLAARGHISVAAREGERTPAGNLTFLSSDRPGLVQDGTVVARGACAQMPAVLRVRNGEVNIVSRRGERTPSGPRIASFGEAQVSSAGAEFFSAFDAAEKIHFLFRSERSDLAEKELLWPKGLPSPSGGFIGVNDHDDFAFLGPIISRPGPAVEGPFTISVRLDERN